MLPGSPNSPASGRSVRGQSDRVLDCHAHDLVIKLDGPRDVEGQISGFSIDAAILKVLNGDPTASVREIAQEANLSALTTLYVLTTRRG
jgi:hypothetical protein